MAAPFVSAAAALVLSLNKELTYLDIKKLLMANVKQLTSLAGKVQSNGSLDLGAALLSVAGERGPQDPPGDEKPGDLKDLYPKQIDLHRKIYKKWYHKHYRLVLFLSALSPIELTKIDKVSYIYQVEGERTQKITSGSIKNAFMAKIKTMKPDQKIKIEILDKKGKTYTMLR